MPTWLIILIVLAFLPALGGAVIDLAWGLLKFAVELVALILEPFLGLVALLARRSARVRA